MKINDEARKYTVDWTGNFSGGNLVCLPGTTSQVSAILRFCNERSIGVVPQGGNTGRVKVHLMLLL